MTLNNIANTSANARHLADISDAASQRSLKRDTLKKDTLKKDTLLGERVPTTRSFRKLQKKLRKQVSHAIADYGMIAEGDKVMVCLSGGKDSYTMLDILLFLQKIAPVHFDVVAVNLDQKQPNFPEHVLPNYLSSRGVDYHILEKDTYSITKRLTPEGKTYCAVCSRLRRGTLYGFADEIGATKVALGHHRDDMIATLFLNLFHGGKLKSMPPKLLSDDGKNILIRPLAYVAEKDIIKYAQMRNFPIIPCNLCGSQENLQRAQINEMLRRWDSAYPKRLDSIAAALKNVAPSQLADVGLFDFIGLEEAQIGKLKKSQDKIQSDSDTAGSNSDASVQTGAPPQAWRLHEPDDVDDDSGENDSSKMFKQSAKSISVVELFSP